MLSLPNNALEMILENGDDRCFEKYIRLNRNVFHRLYVMVDRTYSRTPLSTARQDPRLSRRSYSGKEILFLTLRYLASGVMIDDLALIGGTSPSTVSRSISRCLSCLLAVLRRWKYSRFRIPSNNEEARRLSDLGQANIPGCRNFIGVMDGKVVVMERPDDSNVQNLNFNGKNFTTAVKVVDYW